VTEPSFQGRIAAIYVAPSDGAPMETRDSVRAIAGKGLEGDRYAVAAGTYSGVMHTNAERAVTLIEREAIRGASKEYDVEIGEHETRRNLVTEGVPLNHLVGRDFTVGGVRMRGYKLSEPCAYLEGLTRDGVRKALIHRAGLRAEILDDGEIAVGDTVTAV
jgi:MOSC domain-containing protein YiiM